MLIIEKGTKAEPKPRKRHMYLGSRYLCYHYPVDERQTRGVMCTYTCNQGFGRGFFFCSNALTRYLLVGGVGRHVSLSLSLSFSLARSCSSFTASPGVLLRCTHAPTWSSTFDNDTTAGMTRVSQCRMYLADFDAGTGLQMSWLALQTVVSSKCCLIEVK